MGLVEKTLESPLDSKEIKPVSPKGNQLWIFTGRTAAEAEAPILWPPDAKSWLTGKDPDAGKDWRQEEKGTTEDEIDRMASLTQWTWAWASSGRWWWTGKPGVLQSMGLQNQAQLSNWTTMGLVAPRHVGSSWIRDRTDWQVSCIGRQFLYHWATREAPHKFYSLFSCLCFPCEFHICGFNQPGIMRSCSICWKKIHM